MSSKSKEKDVEEKQPMLVVFLSYLQLLVYILIAALMMGYFFNLVMKATRDKELKPYGKVLEEGLHVYCSGGDESSSPSSSTVKLFVPGATLSSLSYLDAVEASDGVACVYDRRNIMYSSKGERHKKKKEVGNDDVINEMLQDLDTVVNYVKRTYSPNNKIALVSHSLGSLLSTLYVIENLENQASLVSSLVFIDPASMNGWNNTHAENLFQSLDWAKRLGDLAGSVGVFRLLPSTALTQFGVGGRGLGADYEPHLRAMLSRSEYWQEAVAIEVDVMRAVAARAAEAVARTPLSLDFSMFTVFSDNSIVDPLPFISEQEQRALIGLQMSIERFSLFSANVKDFHILANTSHLNILNHQQLPPLLNKWC